MSAIGFQGIPPRPAPRNTEGLLPWLRANLFSDFRTSAGTVIVGAVLL